MCDALFLPRASSTYGSFRSCPVLPARGSSLTQKWVNTSAQHLALCCVFSLPLHHHVVPLRGTSERAACMPISPAGYGIAPLGQKLSLCLPSTHRPLIHMLGMGVGVGVGAGAGKE